MTDETRRSFLAKSGAATLAWAGAMNALGTSETIVVGLIGCGGRGASVAGMVGGVQFVCDPDRKRLGNVAKRLKVPEAQAVTDLRRILDQKAVDAVIIATCDHWHAPAAILACEAGKHAYVEKPISHNFRESQILVETARRTKRVVQHGTQSRSQGVVANAMQMLREGVIGDVLMAKAWNIQRRRNIGHAKPGKAPAEVDYDMWVGPAEFVPFQRNRFHYDWHWWHNFGTGDMGNDGTHEIDYAAWGLGVETHPTTIAGLGGKLYHDDDQQFPDTQTVIFDYPGDGKMGSRRQLIFEMRIWSPTRPYGIDNGAEFYGTEGQLITSKGGALRVLDRKGKERDVKPKDPPKLLAHGQDFLDAIRNERTPNAPVDIAHRTVALVHLGNIACRLGRSLQFDPAKETILGDDEAAKLLTRTYRKDGHWAVPKGV
ncbi:Gfo/Idh/MocA family oxidoreductase [bacterium]|nr:Gfo/Idh/MocA family oxidoreductase [bacterium]